MITSERLGLSRTPDLRRHNLADLLRRLHVGGAMRRADLTAASGLNRSTVAGLVAELVQLGAVLEEPGLPRSELAAGARAGRPSPVVRPCPENVQVLAADVAVGQASVALVGLGGSVLARRSRPIRDSSAGAVAGLLAAIGRELLASPKARRVLAFGVAVPGMVQAGDGKVRFAPNLDWQDAPFGELLTGALAAREIDGLPVRVGNNGDLGVLAEHVRGTARGIDDVVFVEGGAGIGCGVIVAGRLLVGAGGYAGEFGHMKIRRGGRVCRCGSRGCWETEIGAEAIGRALGLPGGSRDDVVTLLRTGGPERAEQLDAVATHLGVGLANVINLLNPRLVVLGGLLLELYPLVSARVDRTLAVSGLRAPLEQITLAVPELGADAVLLGAAEFALHPLLTNPAQTLA